MKKIIVVITSLFCMISCTKKIDQPQKKNLYEDYQFRIQSIDLDGKTTSQTKVWDFQQKVTNIKAITDADNGNGNDHDGSHEGNDCTKHPENPNCVVTPVIFGPISFVQDGEVINASWVALIEVNVKYYLVQASTDYGTTWKTLKTFPPKGQGVKYTTSFSLWTK